MKQTLIALLLSTVATAAAAEENLTPPDRDSSSGWTYTIAPYGFLAGLSGDVASFGAPPASIDLSTSDVLDALDFSLAGVFEARNGRYALGADIFYGSLSDSRPTRFGIIADDLSIESKMTFATAYAAYELTRSDKGRLDVVGGLRYWSVENTFTVSGLPVVGSRALVDDASWVDGLVGLKGNASLSDRLYFSGWALIGTNSMYDVQASVGYSFTEVTSFTVGWRETGVNYSDGDFLFDAKLSGPLLGLVFTF